MHRVNHSSHLQMSSFRFAQCRHPMRVHDRRNSSLGVSAFQTSKERGDLVFLANIRKPIVNVTLSARYADPVADTCVGDRSARRAT